MRILLIGEYNASHKVLKDGLVALGHQVTVVGFGDGFKARKVDVNFRVQYATGLGCTVKKIIYKLIGQDITSLNIRKQFYRQKEIFENYDIVQLINENAFNCIPKIEQELLEYVFEHNSRVYLLSCGTDYISVKYAYEKKFRYSILTPYFEDKGPKKRFSPILKYLLPEYVKLHQYIYSHIKGVIASDLDYEIPLLDHPKYLGMVPNPINTSVLTYIPMTLDGPIKVFHGINDKNYFKKGNYLFEEALAIVEQKHPGKMQVTTVRSVPYAEYIQLFDDCHILLDQVFAFDQGFNALEAMAKGKVVFTGAETEWLDYFGLEEDTVAINALPDAQHIADKLCWLIENPEKILEISKNARAFIEEHHDHVQSAQAYLDKWNAAP